MRCENILRGQPNGSYVIRNGEEPGHYYISWTVDTERSIFKHQPFCISEDKGAHWEYRNGLTGSMEKLADLIPMMMHLSKENCFPILKG